MLNVTVKYLLPHRSLGSGSSPPYLFGNVLGFIGYKTISFQLRFASDLVSRALITVAFSSFSSDYKAGAGLFSATIIFLRTVIVSRTTVFSHTERVVRRGVVNVPVLYSNEYFYRL